MKRKFWIALLPLCGCFCVEAGAQSLSALKSELSTPDPSYGSRVEVCLLYTSRHSPMPIRFPQTMPLKRMNDERITNIFCNAPFPMPSVFSTPIIRVRSSRMISSAAIMLNSATSSITVMILSLIHI